MEDKTYILGFIAGLAAVALVRLLAGRKRRQAQNYDERQMAARGVAYRLAYMTLVGALMADVLVQSLYGPWTERCVDLLLGIFLSVLVFILACVRHDAYFSLRQKPGTYLVLFAAVILAQIPNTMLRLRDGTMIVDGLLTWEALSPACIVLFLAAEVAVWRQSRHAPEEDDDL